MTLVGAGIVAGSALVMTRAVSGQGTVIEIDTDRDVTVGGAALGDSAGIGVATGDVNDDGVQDLVVGAWLADPGAKVRGRHVICAVRAVDCAYSRPGHRRRHSHQRRRFQRLLGARSGDRRPQRRQCNGPCRRRTVRRPPSRSAAGETYVLFGPLTTTPLELSSDTDVTINGIAGSDLSGIDVAVGDLDNDGDDDLIVGARGADPGSRSLAGATYVVFGPLAAGTLELSTAADVTVNGIDPSDQSGIGVAAGDLNDDGRRNSSSGPAARAVPGRRTYCSVQCKRAPSSWLRMPTTPLTASTLETLPDTTLPPVT